ncbi:MAG: putative glycoside hydrolase [Desulfomonilia bacterium]
MAPRTYLSILLMLCWLSCISSPAHAWEMYTVQKGDTLSEIAARYLKLTASYTKQELVNDIKEMNGISSTTLSIGQVLSIPVIREQPIRPKSIRKQKGFSARGVYINQWTAGSRQVLYLAEKIRTYQANTIVFDAKDVRGGLSYRSSIPGSFTTIAQYPYAIEEIAKLVEYLHLMNMHVVARVCVCKDILVSGAMHHWRLETEWLNPANKEVQGYSLAIIEELCSLGVDEIQLDYFRYPADTKTDTGIEGKSRSDVMAEFLSRIHAITRRHGILLSLDMFGIVIWQKPEDIETVGQDVVKMKPYLDIISPMLYPSHFSDNFSGVKNPADEPYLFVSSGIKRLKALVGDEVIVRPWLQSFPLRVTTGYGPEFIEIQIRAAEESGAVGWLLWSPGNRYEDAVGALLNLQERRALHSMQKPQ